MFSPLLCKNLQRAQKNTQTRLSQHRIWMCLRNSFSHSAAGTNMAARCLRAPSTCPPLSPRPLRVLPLCVFFLTVEERYVTSGSAQRGGGGGTQAFPAPPLPHHPLSQGTDIKRAADKVRSGSQETPPLLQGPQTIQGGFPY